ncbi:MAG TPA: HAMP domain-containing sensor histidine kinase [bacterium]|nr:HAMP domain-containing sensor histidine kinase [bacterium]
MTSLSRYLERLLPEYRVRHIFAMKLRLVGFAGFWVIYLYFLRDVLGQTKWIAALVVACFLLTGLAHYNIRRGKLLVQSFALELSCDMVAMLAVIYLTGGPHSAYYTILLFYVFVSGVLYTHALAALVAVAAVLFYAVFLVLCDAGLIPPLILDYGDLPPIPTYTPFAHFVFASVFLAGIVYTVKVSSFFSQRRERKLETRNRELMALQRMSSTVRSAIALDDVIDRLIAGILEGLGFETAVLLLFDSNAGVATVHAPRRTERLSAIESEIGRGVDHMRIPLNSISPLVMQDIGRHRIIFRRRLSELAAGLSDFVTQEQCDAIQERIGARRIVVMPVVVEREALGALIGFAREPFVEEEQVSTMEAFADQSALSLEAAVLIDRLRKLNERLEEANRVKSEFLATMSHELRTPLTAIIGFSELLMEGVMGELNEEQREGLVEVLHNASDLLELINSLLDLTKIESGKMRLEVGSFDLAEACRRVLSVIAPLAQRKGQRLDVEMPDALPPMVGDERKVQQILLNLVGNANKFTPDGGTISFSVKLFRSRREIEEGASWLDRIGEGLNAFSSGAVEIVVRDDGMGISKEHLDRIFEMFHQADGSATRSFGGTGVGLALAKKFVEMHGGLIWVESELGKGARFVVVMPTNERGRT